MKCWIKGYRLSPYARDMRDSVYYKQHHKVITDILERATTQIACNPDHTYQIYGYLVGEEIDKDADCLHWIYVKSPFRQVGISSHLIENFHTTAHKLFYSHQVTDRQLGQYVPDRPTSPKERELVNYIKSRYKESKFMAGLNATYNPYLIYKGADQWQTQHKIAANA